MKRAVLIVFYVVWGVTLGLSGSPPPPTQKMKESRELVEERPRNHISWSYTSQLSTCFLLNLCPRNTFSHNSLVWAWLSPWSQYWTEVAGVMQLISSVCLSLCPWVIFKTPMSLSWPVDQCNFTHPPTSDASVFIWRDLAPGFFDETERLLTAVFILGSKLPIWPSFFVDLDRGRQIGGLFWFANLPPQRVYLFPPRLLSKSEAWMC